VAKVKVGTATMVPVNTALMERRSPAAVVKVCVVSEQVRAGAVNVQVSAVSTPFFLHVNAAVWLAAPREVEVLTPKFAIVVAAFTLLWTSASVALAMLPPPIGKKIVAFVNVTPASPE
jgi:hypothetical protein